MKPKIKVYANSQCRIALGIVKAYQLINPKATMEDFKKAFPNNLNPDCGSKQIFMAEGDIDTHVANGEEWYKTGRGYLNEDSEWLVMPDGERVGFVNMWSESSYKRMVEHAQQYGILTEMSEVEHGSYRLEYLNGFDPSNTAR